MNWKGFVKDTELLSDVAKKYYAAEEVQKRHRKEYFENLGVVVNGTSTS